MGKKAVPIAYLNNDQSRRNTFKKRLVGLMKKIHDLSILCDAQIAIVVIDENKDIFPYTNNETIEEVWNQYFAKDIATKSNRLLECKKILETETKKIEIACNAKRKTKQDISQNLEPHHSVPQNVEVQYGAFQNNGVHHQTNWSINSNRPQYQINQRNRSSSMETKQEGNSNNWFNDVNHGNKSHDNEVYQTPYFGPKGNNHQGYGYNIKVKENEVHHQFQANIQGPTNHQIDVDHNHPRYGYNFEFQDNEVHHQFWTNFQDPLYCQINVDVNHPRHGNSIEDQGHEVHHQSSALLQDLLDYPIDASVFEKAHLTYTSSNLETSSVTNSVTNSVPLSNELSIIVSSSSFTKTPILLEDASSTSSPMQGNTPYTRPTTSIEWKLIENWNDLDEVDLDLDLEDLEDKEDKEDTKDS